MNGDDDITPALPTSCPHCSSTEFYVRRLSAAGGQGPHFVDGFGKFLHYAHFDVVICAECGLTQFFAAPLARKNVPPNPDLRPIRPRRPQPDGDADVFEDNGDVTGPDDVSVGNDEDLDGLDDVSEPTLCLDCRSVIPAGADTCPQCGWTYKPEG